MNKKQQTNDIYHKNTMGPGLRPYLSSSVFKAVIKQEIKREQTSCLGFGDRVHGLIEGFLKDPSTKYVYIGKKEKIPVCREGETIVKGTPAELLNLKACYQAWKKYWNQTTFRGKMDIEQSFFTNHNDIKNFKGKIPPSLKGLHDFILKKKVHIKTRPDLLIHGDILNIEDWKTTRHAQVGKMERDLFMGYDYAFSFALYALNCLYHGMGQNGIQGNIVMLHKAKQMDAPVCFKISLESMKFKRYLNKFVRGLEMNWDDRWKNYRKARVQRCITVEI